MATSGSVCAPALDVEATALSVMGFVVARADCGGFGASHGGKKSRMLSRLGGRWKWKVGLVSEREIPRPQSPQ